MVMRNIQMFKLFKVALEYIVSISALLGAAVENEHVNQLI